MDDAQHWMTNHQDDAYREGWGVFENDDGSVEIQRLDDPAILGEGYPGECLFESDAAARRHVMAEARNGSEMHALALRQVKGAER